MVVYKSWATAFINTLEKEGADFEDALNTFLALGSCLSALPGEAAGTAAAEKLEPLFRRSLAADGADSKARETALRFLLLMVRRNKTRLFNSVAKEIKSMQDRKRGIVAVTAEYAFEPDAELRARIYETVKKRTGAKKIEMEGRLNPGLIGGFRLRIGDEVIDASLRTQLLKMESCLAAGTTADGGKQW